MRRGRSLPGGDASGARQGTSQDTGKATVQTNKASLFSALPFPRPSLRTICACPRHTFSATARKKLPEKGAFFMRCRFRTKRSQQKQGWRGGRDFHRRAATAVRAVPRSCRGRAPADNTRWGWKGRKKRSSSRAGSDRMAAADHSRRDEGSCGQRQSG